MNLPIIPNSINIAFCENDGNGNRHGRVCMITVEHPKYQETCLALEHENLFDDGTKIWCNDRVIEIHGYRFKYSVCGEMVGNVHWNLYALPADYAVGLLNRLIYSKEWRAEYGHSELFKKFNGGQELTTEDFELLPQIPRGFAISEPLGLFENEV